MTGSDPTEVDPLTDPGMGTDAEAQDDAGTDELPTPTEKAGARFTSRAGSRTAITSDSKKERVPGTKVIEVQRLVNRHFTVLDVRWDMRHLIFFIKLDRTLIEDSFEKLRLSLKPLALYPMLRPYKETMMLVVTPKPEMEFRSPRVNLAMLILTIFSTIWAGALFWGGYANTLDDDLSWQVFFVVWTLPGTVAMGALTFALPLMTILGIHELGHYFMARRHGLEASLPFFIPLPFTLLGTMGAFISIREPIPNRKALLDIGISGPIAGFLVAIPITLIGLLLTKFYAAPVPENTAETTLLGVPAMFILLEGLSQALVPGSGDYLIHPVAFAGWAGFLVTALNLLPAGQLDGGHVARAILGEKAQFASLGAVTFMLILGLFGLPMFGIPPFQGWLIFALFIMVMGLQHPPPLEDYTELDHKRMAMGGVAIFMLLSSFVFAPLQMGESPYDFAIRPEDQSLSLNETQFAAANYTFTFQVDVNNTGEIWDNFTINLTISRTLANWTLGPILLNGSALNDTALAGLSKEGLRLDQGQSATVIFQLVRDPTTAPETTGEATLKVRSSKGETTRSMKFTGLVEETEGDQEDGAR